MFSAVGFSCSVSFDVLLVLVSKPLDIIKSARKVTFKPITTAIFVAHWRSRLPFFEIYH